MLRLMYSNPVSLIPFDLAAIRAAVKTLDIAAYTFVDADLVAAVRDRAAAGVAVRLYLDRTELQSAARGDPNLTHCPLNALLNCKNVTVLVKASSILMHMKSYCVDGTVLRDGSANFSPTGEMPQDNSAWLTDDPACIAAFQAKFLAMWCRPDNVTVPEAVLTSPAYARTPAHRGQTGFRPFAATDTLT